ncbi:YicC/YloC family endoribonuclease [Salinarimonas soli]|uniref:YicC family protein n=1 Tax=Salinarimonas soli TaxID=1638099 RepID=A0A5B2V9F9_9HYPH|nr:YicC/YloC family endoribonuclease [Salinarimonas soli]KAA2235476.1 YicC family protein [Salinarimonas soli]
MAIASMTGFAREAGATGPYQWAWEIKSVNGRGLDVRVRMPPGFDAVGEEARAALQKALGRGQCQLGLALARAAGAPRVRINREVLDSLLATLRETTLPDGVRPASVDGLLAVRGVVEIEEADDAPLQEALAADLRAAIPGLVRALVEARLAEGRALAEVIAGQLDAIEALVTAADEHPGRRPEAIRERLAAQVAALMETGTALDPARLHGEAALLAARADIREELDRLHAHVASAREMLGLGGAVGRRLDFLAQEFGREANTLCAKANDVALSRLGLDLKAVVEQFREQVQNVE